jgi:hypothetical protein
VVEPLKLKRQKIDAKPIRIKESEQSGYVAEVLVQTPVSFVEQIYSYAIPLVLSETGRCWFNRSNRVWTIKN